MGDEYDPVQRIMTKALNISQGFETSQGKFLRGKLVNDSIDDKK